MSEYLYDYDLDNTRNVKVYLYRMQGKARSNITRYTITGYAGAMPIDPLTSSIAEAHGFGTLTPAASSRFRKKRLEEARMRQNPDWTPKIKIPSDAVLRLEILKKKLKDQHTCKKVPTKSGGLKWVRKGCQACTRLKEAKKREMDQAVAHVAATEAAIVSERMQGRFAELDFHGYERLREQGLTQWEYTDEAVGCYPAVENTLSTAYVVIPPSYVKQGLLADPYVMSDEAKVKLSLAGEDEVNSFLKAATDAAMSRVAVKWYTENKGKAGTQKPIHTFKVGQKVKAWRPSKVRGEAQGSMESGIVSRVDGNRVVVSFPESGGSAYILSRQAANPLTRQDRPRHRHELNPAHRPASRETYILTEGATAIVPEEP